MSTESADGAEEQLFEVEYGIEDKPPLLESIVLGVQHFLTMSGAQVAGSLALVGILGMQDAAPGQVGLVVSTFFVVAGITTILQSTFGMRYPVVQVPAFAYIPPAIAVVSVVAARDPSMPVWNASMLELQGAIIGAGVVEVLIGAFGIMGLVRRYITPVVIAPTIAMIAIAVYNVDFVIRPDQDWALAGFTLLLIVAFSQLLDERHRLFRLYPVILGITIAWIVAAILSVAGVYAPGSVPYVDLGTVAEAQLVRPVLPFQFGTPTFTTAFFIGMISAVVVSVIESFGDYHAIATVSGIAAPSSKRINYGIFTEGIGSIIGGMFGSFGVTSATENIGAVGITGVASRHVVRWGGIAMLFVASIGYFGAIVATIPDAILAGMFLAILGQVVGIAFAQLEPVNLSKNRNLFVIGFAIYAGLSIPAYMAGLDAGVETFRAGINAMPIVGAVLGAQVVSDTVFTVFSSGMSIAVISGLLLDNVLPGTPEDRGLTHLADAAEKDEEFETFWAKNGGRIRSMVGMD